ncbi:cytochrome-c oxidase [Vandammella animalimorsus]|uniref:Cytochrome-c oxidase n=1 Tax=Vandammella animalimorsus TaxID=2029117 RepID=A0A3M6RI77_9BURK|nr:cytochrome-c oxidase [Vandammella animalimorsus]RMX14859.1 cytochrome-c oxidase [Vandammella animalimorsus]
MNRRHSLILRRAAAALAACALCTAALAQAQSQAQTQTQARAPIKTIDIYVSPYYEAAGQQGARPRVAVFAPLDALLASSAREDVERARDAIAKEPDSLTPMTLMVLAIRLYDVGLRDEAVFWFYAAKNRYLTLEAVLDVSHPSLSQAGHASRSFLSLAGPYINSYAFCDLDKQQRLLRQSIAWTQQHPYAALWMQQLPAKPGDRRQNFAQGLQDIRDMARQEQDHLADPKRRAEYQAQRKARHVDEQFCWKD